VLGEDFFPTATVGWTSYQAGVLGSATSACFCGWVVDGSCYLPAQVCQDVLWQEILDESVLQGFDPHPGYADGCPG
jgi:hypothetical protein